MDIFSDLKLITYYKNIIIYYINTIWNKFSGDIKKEFDSKPGCYNKFLENQNKISW